MPNEGLRKRLADELDAPLRVQARKLAFGLVSGGHRAARKGSGIEFAGHRPYSPGDDLRHLDRHALLRHGRLLVREFHTDTERAVHVVVDVSGSMNYRGQEERTTKGEVPLPSKGQRALLLAAALSHAASQVGDAVGFSLVGDRTRETFRPRTGREALERALSMFEGEYEKFAEPSEGPARPESSPVRVHDLWVQTIDHLGARLPRGAVLFVLSDFLDVDEELQRRLLQLCSRGRTIRATQVLTRDEVDFPFEGALRLVDPESGQEVETDAAEVRAAYQDRLAALTSGVSKELETQGGMWLRHVTDESPEPLLHRLALGVHR